MCWTYSISLIVFCDQVMILELCQYVQAFLRDHNKPPSMSFYEEMVSNQKKQEEKLAKEQQKKQELIKKREEKQVEYLSDSLFLLNGAFTLKQVGSELLAVTRCVNGGRELLVQVPEMSNSLQCKQTLRDHLSLALGKSN